MADVFATLLQSALYKRAALMEQWLVQHKEHYPGPKISEYVESLGRQRGACSCGSDLELNLLISVEVRATGKDGNY